MLLILSALIACNNADSPAQAAKPTPAHGDAENKTDKAEAPKADPEMARYTGAFQPLPEHMHKGEVPPKELIDLGRMLYYENRISKNHDLSCNSCHMLDKFGVDNEPTSPGHKGERGARNSPTTYNAAIHIAQFWDGREPDVEAQAKGPVLNPVEMAMPDADHVVKVLKSIPGYVEAFKKAFPGQQDPINYDNFAIAVGAFERGLVTPGPFDKYLTGQADALSDQQQKGLKTFVDTGCTTCHLGAGLGGNMYQKLGLVHAYETDDLGRYEVTENEAEKYFFKVPSLRNIKKTGPYFHDGSVATIDDAIRKMAHHQLGKELTDKQVADISAFLDSLTGEIPQDYIKKPELPESGPNTPPPDPS